MRHPDQVQQPCWKIVENSKETLSNQLEIASYWKIAHSQGAINAKAIYFQYLWLPQADDYQI
jgi:hypothetical protein